ncbi:hypothetical protein Bca4012_037045 [Brassica carinata]
MAFNKNLKLNAPMVEDYGSSLEEAFNKEMEASTEHYRAKLFIYKQLNDAVTKKHDEEREVSRIQGKLELMNEFFNKSALSKEKEKPEFELVLAKAKAADVKLPYIDWPIRLRGPLQEREESFVSRAREVDEEEEEQGKRKREAKSGEWRILAVSISVAVLYSPTTSVSFLPFVGYIFFRDPLLTILFSVWMKE